MTFPVENDHGELVGAADSLISDLIHDLRQPLSNIECSVCYLRMQLQMSRRAGEHLDLIDNQLQKAEQMLLEATARLRRLRAQRDLESAVDAASLELTKSATAALT